jgi:gamma-glutamylcyclotransferase (GGCT)/AIG2-like uncharacterized protein YtfP
MHHTRIQLIVENKMNAPQNIYMSLILFILNQRYFQWTGNPEDIVHGVVYQFDPEEWSALDAAESGYDRTPIQVHTDSGTRDVTTYLARKERVDESLKPYT